jgi:hypothetical protein
MSSTVSNILPISSLRHGPISDSGIGVGTGGGGCGSKDRRVSSVSTTSGGSRLLVLGRNHHHHHHPSHLLGTEISNAAQVKLEYPPPHLLQSEEGEGFHPSFSGIISRGNEISGVGDGSRSKMPGLLPDEMLYEGGGNGDAHHHHHHHGHGQITSSQSLSAAFDLIFASAAQVSIVSFLLLGFLYTT